MCRVNVGLDKKEEGEERNVVSSLWVSELSACYAIYGIYPVS